MCYIVGVISCVYAYACDNIGESLVFVRNVYNAFLINKIKDYSVYKEQNHLLSLMIDSDLDLYLMKKNISASEEDVRMIELYVLGLNFKEMSMYENAIKCFEEIKQITTSSINKVIISEIESEIRVISSYMIKYGENENSPKTTSISPILCFEDSPSGFLFFDDHLRELSNRTLTSRCFILFEEFHKNSKNLKEVERKISLIEKQLERDFCSCLFYLYYGIGEKFHERKIIDIAAKVNEKECYYVLGQILRYRYKRLKTFSSWLTEMLLYRQTYKMGFVDSLYKHCKGVELNEKDEMKLGYILDELWQYMINTNSSTQNNEIDQY